MRTAAITSRVIATMLAASASVQAASPGTAFTYQGRLKDGGSPANGVYDLQFAMFYDAVNNVQAGSTLALEDQQVTDGLFTVVLDFGAGIINGDALWLAVSVRPGPSGGAFTPLTPREKITPTPYAIALALPYSGSAATANSLISLSQFGNGSGVTMIATGTGSGIVSAIANNANASPAVAGSTDGSGNAVQGSNSGAGRAANFQITSASNSSDALQATTVGTGHAGYFKIDKASNPNAAVAVLTTGTGSAVLAHSGTGIGLQAQCDGTGDAVYGVNPGTGRAGQFEILNANNGSNALVGKTNGNGNAGHFLITKASSTAAALHAETSGPGSAIEARQTAATGIGVDSTTTGGGTAVSGHAEGSGVGVWGQADGTGAAMFARHNAGASGTALRVDQGAIRVTNSGFNSATAAFVVCLGADNSGGNLTIDNPMTNGDPNAILIVTTQLDARGTPITTGTNTSAPWVYYNAFNYNPGRWEIFYKDNSTMYKNTCFNVLVIKN